MTLLSRTDSLRPEVVDFFSPSNRRRFTVWSWVPPGSGPFPLLLLLHGVADSGGHGWWLRGQAPAAVAALVSDGLREPPVLLMPSDTGAELGSGYADWVDGTTRAETFIVEELLEWAATSLPVDDRRWVTGLSMGGYGALLLALRHPELFDSATATSAFFTPSDLLSCLDVPATRIWADSEARDQHDVTHLISDPGALDRLRVAFDCGRSDRHLTVNRALHAQLVAAQAEHGYAEHPGGHDWNYWAAYLPDHIRFHAGLPGPLRTGWPA